MIGVYPGDGGGHHAEVEMISNSMWRSGLAFYASNLLLDLFETGIDLAKVVFQVHGVDEHGKTITQAIAPEQNGKFFRK